jgi:hypothetical protein
VGLGRRPIHRNKDCFEARSAQAVWGPPSFPTPGPKFFSRM